MDEQLALYSLNSINDTTSISRAPFSSPVYLRMLCLSALIYQYYMQNQSYQWDGLKIQFSSSHQILQLILHHMHNQKKALLLTCVVAIVAATLFYLNPAQPSNLLSKQPSPLLCIERKTIIQRAQDWVTKHVPYNQGGSHDGYRTDCSGFVSMAWQLAKPGLTTFTMHTVSKNVTKAELLHGDAMNCDTHHIVLFAGWSSSDKSHYVAMQQANTAEGTVKKVIPYPYFNGDNCFHPIRYDHVC